MLAFLGFLTVALMLALIIWKKLTPTVALIAVPLVTGLIACAFTVTDPESAPGQVDFWANAQNLGGMVVGTQGIGSVAATGVMFLFSILFFGVLTDAGTFRPIIGGIIKHMGSNPLLITLGTALLAMCVHLDGSGAVTFLICVPPLVPLYDAMGMKRTTLATTVALSAGTMNILPWGGPTIRAASALGAGDPVGFFLPVLPAIGVGLVCVLGFALLLGLWEKSRAGRLTLASGAYQEQALTPEQQALLRPKLFWVNLSLIILAIVSLLVSGLAPAVVFMVFYILATVINYPHVEQSKARVDAHAQSAMMMCSVLFAAGCFCGIMKGSGMIDGMAQALVSVMPNSLARFFPLITGVISMPASLLFDPDSFYYGVLPILGETAKGFGVDPLMVGRAAILGQMTTGFPVSPLSPATFLLVGLAGVDLGEHQKKTIPFAFALTLAMLAVAVLTGSITL
ncbi:CitMHS family transporter [Acutalibacter caecimuris]|uniref:CitMHS family transporter n=1 Tax=Acutalibacter caecimuris TaxID=3093657 RepID=UPI002AC962F1|nr:citrate:proton symporter [Acutalibacter sp. M00118]